MEPPVTLLNDEPVSIEHDHLGRTRLVKALESAIKTCRPPFVLAVNGGWGAGKTSILKCLEEQFKKKGSGKRGHYNRTVWFSPWKFQFEDSPAVSLLQQIRTTAEQDGWFPSGAKSKREGLKLLDIVGTLAGEIVLKTVTGGAVSTRDIINQGAAFEEKYFEAKQLGARMQEAFRGAIEALVGKGGRLVFFIDDLDRCRTEHALRLLEALKLFLNAPNCVYVIAIDMDNLAKNLREVCKLPDPRDYLEKIFQLVYTLPPPLFEDKREMVVKLLETAHPGLFKDGAPACLKNDLADYLGDNPRKLKHFCNRFLLESGMMAESLGDKYNPVFHMFLQLLQVVFPTAFKLFRSSGCLPVNRRGEKYLGEKRSYHHFVNEWADFFNHKRKSGELCIGSGFFHEYFPYMPCLSRPSPLEETYKFVTLTLGDSAQKGVICLENHERNRKILSRGNLSDLEDLSGTVLRGLNLSYGLLDRCNFEGADLSNTDLSNADCTGASIELAMLNHAGLEGVKGQKLPALPIPGAGGKDEE